MYELKHQEDIASSHSEGFGGTNSEMLAKIGNRGLSALSQTDKKIIAVVKKLIPFESIPSTPEMAAGHLFETFLAETVFCDAKEVMREKLLEKSLAKNFRTFAHADFYDKENNYVAECKYSQKNTEEVLEIYKYQLQNYFLMGADAVTLIHGSGEVKPFRVDDYSMISIDRDEKLIDEIKAGIKLLDEAWDELPLDIKKDIEASELLSWDAKLINDIAEMVQQIKHLEAAVEEKKSQLMRVFETEGYKSVKGDSITISYVDAFERKTFDKAAFAKAHPKIDLSKFDKISKIRSTLKITLR